MIQPLTDSADSMLAISTGTITVNENGQKRQYENAEEILNAVTTKMDVKKIVSPEVELVKAEEGRWCDWAENYIATTGQDVSVLYGLGLIWLPRSWGMI